MIQLVDFFYCSRLNPMVHWLNPMIHWLFIVQSRVREESVGSPPPQPSQPISDPFDLQPWHKPSKQPSNVRRRFDELESIGAEHEQYISTSNMRKNGDLFLHGTIWFQIYYGSSLVFFSHQEWYMNELPMTRYLSIWTLGWVPMKGCTCGADWFWVKADFGGPNSDGHLNLYPKGLGYVAKTVWPFVTTYRQIDPCSAGAVPSQGLCRLSVRRVEDIGYVWYMMKCRAKR